MTKEKHYKSLQLKMIVLLIILSISSFVGFFTLQKIGNYYIDKVYIESSSMKKRTDSLASKFDNYVQQNSVCFKDENKILSWLKKNKYADLAIVENGKIIFHYGEYYFSGEQYSLPTKKITKNSSFCLDSINGYNCYEIAFSDQKCNVYLYDYTFYKIDSIYRLMCFIIVFSIFVIVILLFEKEKTKRIIKLANEINDIKSGNLRRVIDTGGNDEITYLAYDTDEMRLSLIEKLNNEQLAIQANYELVTAMSHDIRTPLTSLLGYLDIIKSEKYNDEKQRQRYIETCIQKAYQLKELSDKLFRYFLVFGVNKKMETIAVDANILFEQILGEQVYLFSEKGFEFVISKLESEIYIKVDVDSVRRVFDNIFSNLLKYADKTKNVLIFSTLSENTVSLQFLNKKKSDTSSVESTKIGLKSCVKIMKQIGGTFDYTDDGSNFIVKVTFLTTEKPEDDSLES